MSMGVVEYFAALEKGGLAFPGARPAALADGIVLLAAVEDPKAFKAAWKVEEEVTRGQTVALRLWADSLWGYPVQPVDIPVSAFDIKDGKVVVVK